MVTVVIGSRGATRPFSIAKGPTPASILPQLGETSTSGWSMETWAKRYSTSTSGRSEREMIATLLVRGSAPPMPSICRASGEPMAASSTRSRNAISPGRSIARKNGPFDVPPRMRVQGMGVCDTRGIQIPSYNQASLILETHFRDSCAQAVDVEAKLSPRQPLTGCLFLANPLFARPNYFLGGCALHRHDTVVICHDHIASVNVCTRTDYAHIHRSEVRLHGALRTDGAAPDRELHFGERANITASCLNDKPLHAVGAQRCCQQLPEVSVRARRGGGNHEYVAGLANLDGNVNHQVIAGRK